MNPYESPTHCEDEQCQRYDIPAWLVCLSLEIAFGAVMFALLIADSLGAGTYALAGWAMCISFVCAVCGILTNLLPPNQVPK